MDIGSFVARPGQIVGPAEFKELIALAAFAFSIFSLALSWFQTRAARERARKAEDIASLLGEKETVAYAALKLQRDGLPDKDLEHRTLLLRAIMTACVFSSSDRARALLYDMLYRAPIGYREEIEAAWSVVAETFNRIETIMLDPEIPKVPADEFDLVTGKQRLALVRAVLDAPPPSCVAKVARQGAPVPPSARQAPAWATSQ